jgi:hypothetical protein
MIWNEHFVWSNNVLEIVAKSETGRVTIELLQLNRPRLLVIRADDYKVQRHPPSEDEILNLA